MGKLKVIRAGILATVQDSGRTGRRKYGIPQSGAMDKQSMELANFLVGNDTSGPVLEIALQGLSLRAEEDTIVTLTGGEAEMYVNKSSTDMNCTVLLKAGDTLTVSDLKKGVYCYLGIAGKWRCKEAFGSMSTYLMAGFGGMDGRAIRKGDILETSGKTAFRQRTTPEVLIPKFPNKLIIRILSGPEIAVLTHADALEDTLFSIHPSSNRMGIRLTGNQLENNMQEMLTSPVIPGTIQLPPNGEPIILMNDCQTSGGYPGIAKVIAADMDHLSQMRGGQQLKFRVVELEEARELYEFREKTMSLLTL